MREFPEAAGIPVLPALAALLGPFVDDVEAVAGGADKGAGAATDAAGGDGIPGRVFEVFVQPRLDLLQVEGFGPRFGQRNCFCVVRFAEEAGVAVDQCFALVAESFAGVPSPLQRGQEQVAPLGVGRREPHRGAEAGVVGFRAGQPDDGGLFSALQEKFVLVIPGKDRIQHRYRCGVAGTHPHQHGFREARRIDVLELDLLPFLCVGHDVLAQREEGFLAGSARQLVDDNFAGVLERFVERSAGVHTRGNHTFTFGDQFVQQGVQVLFGDVFLHSKTFISHREHREHRGNKNF